LPSYSTVTKSGFIWSVLARGFNEIVSIPTSMVLARMLSPQDFGIAAAAGFFVQLSNRLTNFGFNTALIQIKDLTEGHTSTVFFVNVVMGLGVWAVLVLTSPLLGQLFHSEAAAHVIPIAALSFVIGSIGSVPSALMVRDLRFREVAWLEWLATIVTTVTVLPLALLGYGYWSLVYSQVVAAAVQTVARFYMAGWRPRFRFSAAVLRQMFSFGVGLHAKRLLDSVALNVDNLVIGSSLGLSALGFYDKAFTLMNRATNGLNSAGPVVSFRVFALIHEDQERFRNAYRKVLLAATFLAYPVFTALAISAEDLFEVMFGSQWVSAVVPFQILCLAGCLRVPNAYASTAIQSRGSIWGEVWRQGVYVALIAGGVALGSFWSGLVGASVGVLAATAVMTVLMQTLLRAVSGLRWKDVLAPQVPAVLCSAGLALCLGATVMTLRLTNDVPALVSLGVAVLVSAVYGLVFARMNRFSELRRVIDETVQDYAPRLARFVTPAPRDGASVETPYRSSTKA
jgi:teichuronic acid exporter